MSEACAMHTQCAYVAYNFRCIAATNLWKSIASDKYYNCTAYALNIAYPVLKLISINKTSVPGIVRFNRIRPGSCQRCVYHVIYLKIRSYSACHHHRTLLIMLLL